MIELEEYILNRIDSLEKKLIEYETRLLAVELVQHPAYNTWNVPQWAVPKVTCKDTN